MRNFTKQEMKDVIDGKAKLNRVPMIYKFNIKPWCFKDREKEMEDFLSENIYDIENFHVKVPHEKQIPPEYPNHKWGRMEKTKTEKIGLDAEILYPEWEDMELLYNDFPDPNHPYLIQNADLDQSKYIVAHWGRILFERHWGLRGMENALTDYYLYPDEVHRLYAKITQYTEAVIERSHNELHADAVFITDDIGTQTGPFFSPEIFREFFKPYYKQLIQKAHSLGMHFWMHTCGGIEPFLNDLIEIGLDVIHPLQKYTVDYKEIAEKYGGKICFLVGFDVQQIIPYGTTEDVREEVRNIIDTFAREDGRLIMDMGNGCTPDWKFESIQALYDETLTYSQKFFKEKKNKN